MMDMQTMAALLALVLLTACLAAPFIRKRKSRIDREPDYADLNTVARPWRRVTADEE